MADTRHKNANWGIHNNSNGTVPKEDARLAVLMDIRDELQALRRIFECGNFLDIPRKLDHIRKNTAKKRPKLKVVKRRAA